MLQEEDVDGDAVCVLCWKNAFPHDSDTTDSDDPDFTAAVVVNVNRPCGHVMHDRCQQIWIHSTDLCSRDSRRRSCAECGLRYRLQQSMNANRSKDILRTIGNTCQTFRRADIDTLVQFCRIPEKEAAKYSTAAQQKLRLAHRGSGDHIRTVKIPRRHYNHYRNRILPEAFYENIHDIVEDARVCSIGHTIRVILLIVVGIVLLLYCWFSDDSSPYPSTLEPGDNTRPFTSLEEAEQQQ